MKNLITKISLVTYGLIATAPLALAQSTGESSTISANPNSAILTIIGRITSLLDTGIDYLFAIGGSLLIAMIVWGGIRYITGSAEGGKKTITAALIGIAIMVFAYVIIYAVINILGGSGGGLIQNTSPIDGSGGETGGAEGLALFPIINLFS